MAIDNLQYLYDHLPARMRRADQDMFLKRFLQLVGEHLDSYDLTVDTFFELINPDTAPQQFVDFWLWALFGWGWFPTWFTADRRRAFYAAIGSTHYPERGTLAGIKHFLSAFGLRVLVEGGPRFWGEETWGSNQWTVVGPLGIVVRLFPEAPAIDRQLEFWGEFTWAEAFPFSPSESIQLKDVDQLLRFQWPLAHEVLIEELQFETIPEGIRAGYGDAEYGSTQYG